jgi:hypothetical protein
MIAIPIVLVAMVITQVDLYDNEADALEAAGLSE